MTRIVPRSRLLAAAAAVLLPASLVVAAAPESTVPIGVFVALFVSIVVADALGAPGALRGLTVSLPPVVRLTRGVEGVLELTLDDARAPGRTLRVGLLLPEALAASDEQLLRLPRGDRRSRVPWPLRSGRRGRFLIETCAVECASPAGLWALQARLPVRSEVRVYPNLVAERRSLASVFLKRGAGGAHAMRQIGRGREFEKLREYVPGDATDEIHWKATARRGRPITKVFQVERTQEVYVVLDASRLSARLAPGRAGEDAEPTIERFVTAALLLSLAAARQGDLFGLVVFDARVRTFLRARNGAAHARACRDALAGVEALPVTPDFDELATFLRLNLRRRALLLFLTELDDPALAEAFSRGAGLLSRQHLMLAHGIRPAYAQPLFADSGASSAEDVYERLGGHMVWRGLRELEATLGRRGVRFSLLSAEALAAELVSSYLNVKRRQFL